MIRLRGRYIEVCVFCNVHQGHFMQPAIIHHELTKLLYV